ncbi:hypothetical protein ACQKWADRAFT_131655 [Trichoderma austrokoningii]
MIETLFFFHFMLALARCDRHIMSLQNWGVSLQCAPRNLTMQPTGILPGADRDTIRSSVSHGICTNSCVQRHRPCLQPWSGCLSA